ncbi:MAG TPA: hypothetical protein VE980_09670 [Pyrinomonadaceae bacterium]|nr:hypothetical protein [Pyrinomonadaceae bacterium]
MKKKQALIGLLVAIAITAGLAFTFQSSQGQQQQKPPMKSIPDYEVYHQLFHHHVALKKKANDLEKLGKDGKFLHGFYQREAKLSDQEARTFDEIASQCDEEVSKLDRKAGAIIDEALAKNANGKLPKDANPPEPPAELKNLWDQRNTIILRAKDRLEAAFGPPEFKRLEEFVRSHVEARMTIDPGNRQRPAERIGPRHQQHLQPHPPQPGR